MSSIIILTRRPNIFKQPIHIEFIRVYPINTKNIFFLNFSNKFFPYQKCDEALKIELNK